MSTERCNSGALLKLFSGSTITFSAYENIVIASDLRSVEHTFNILCADNGTSLE
jgi:hypothetical protein